MPEIRMSCASCLRSAKVGQVAAFHSNASLMAGFKIQSAVGIAWVIAVTLFKGPISAAPPVVKSALVMSFTESLLLLVLSLILLSSSVVFAFRVLPSTAFALIVFPSTAFPFMVLPSIILPSTVLSPGNVKSTPSVHMTLLSLTSTSTSPSPSSSERIKGGKTERSLEDNDRARTISVSSIRSCGSSSPKALPFSKSLSRSSKDTR
mmetsp:Transcript_27522/g.50815  ORF Transcript_27522/g.50815 Transcript_27522/m.50815 type:complete len:206 (+) Transcript_27522:743-1360(+)